MFRVTIETEHMKSAVEIPESEVGLDEALEAIEGALYGVTYRFKGKLDFVEA